ncbi:MFS general substrate transporter [Xylariaceae sp. FL0016]|nr:MFS general substrate transporter [Xylariaceae sp. FL0016]
MSTPDTYQIEMAEKKELSIMEATASHDEMRTEVDPKFARRLKWKLDLFILPVISSVYFFAAIGRSDLANAKIAGLTEELGLSPKAYSNAATMFLVGYIVFQLPGTLLIKKIRAPVQFAGAMIAWGFVTAITVLIKNKAELLVVRFLIGGAEAFVQGGVFYLSFWYEYRELATRGAIFFSMSTLAGAFNGLIAYAISKNLDGANGWLAWRWIFLIEGVIPIAFAFLVIFLLPASPFELKWGFNKAEKEHIIERAARAHNTAEAKLEWKKVPKILLDVQFWLFCLIACGGHFCLASFSNFLPAIIEGLGYNGIDAQIFTVIVYACAFVGILFWCRLADKTNARGTILVASTAVAAAGYAILIATKNEKVQFAATCLVAFGTYPHLVLHLSWAAMNFIGYTRRGSALAFFNIISQLFAISGTQAYSDPPYCEPPSLPLSPSCMLI